MENNRIAYMLNTALASGSTPQDTGIKAVEAHNAAVKYGFLNLPLLEFHAVDTTMADEYAVVVKVMSGLVKIDELYNLKQAWGADELELCEGKICLCFYRE